MQPEVVDAMVVGFCVVFVDFVVVSGNIVVDVVVDFVVVKGYVVVVVDYDDFIVVSGNVVVDVERSTGVDDASTVVSVVQYVTNVVDIVADDDCNDDDY